MKVKKVADVPAVEMLPGIFRKTLVYNTDAMVCHFDLRARAVIELHKHPAAQLGYVISGKAEFWYESKENATVVVPGDSYIIPGNVVHGATMIEDTTLIECFSPARPEYENE